MSIELNTTLTISCNESEEYSGPTIVHSTGVPAYKVSPEVIGVLQEALSNDRLCDDQLGVQCLDSVASVIQAFQNAGFEIISEHYGKDRKMWTITKTS